MPTLYKTFYKTIYSRLISSNLHLRIAYTLTEFLAFWYQIHLNIFCLFSNIQKNLANIHFYSKATLQYLIVIILHQKCIRNSQMNDQRNREQEYQDIKHAKSINICTQTCLIYLCKCQSAQWDRSFCHLIIISLKQIKNYLIPRTFISINMELQSMPSLSSYSISSIPQNYAN